LGEIRHLANVTELNGLIFPFLDVFEAKSAK
jgi:hypothetical protein